ncbi:uncharacterized protein LOC134269113 [Saccostrea cucullata]|uniref:uncharacterized protein LOC134269113 n=1 Tax=Saccostrea cuccullata TaxID=36930 RepID=UPI002ED121F3
MSSAYQSRDLNPSGRVPAIELGYPSVVLFTFIPSEKESSEIPVSEGDIVQLLYSVGGWVFVRTYEGNVGYIPLDFCGELESSKEVGAVFKGDSSVQKALQLELSYQRSEDVTDFRNSSDNSVERLISFENSETLIDTWDNAQQNNTNYSDEHVNSNSNQRSYHSLANQQNFNTTICENRLWKSNNSDYELSILSKSLSCDICNAFLSRLISGVHSLAITDKEKADLKSRKLLKLLQRATQEGLNLISNIRYLTGYGQTCCAGFKENGIRSGNDLDQEPVPEFGAHCMQCEILREFFKLSEKYSMTDLYATIRDLHIHALSDSDSDPDSGTHLTSGSIKKDETKTWASKNDEKYKVSGDLKSRNAEFFLGSKSPNEIKRSVSFQLEDRSAIKSEIMRNNSFSGEMTLAKSNDVKDDGSQNRESLHSGYSQKTVDSGIADVHDDLDSSFQFEPKSEVGEERDENSNLQERKVPLTKPETSKTPTNFDGSGVYGFQALLHSKMPSSPRLSSTKPSAQRTPRNEAAIKRQDAFKQKTTPFLGKLSPRESNPTPSAEPNASIQPSVSKMSFSQRTLDKSKTFTEIEPSSSLGAGSPLIKLDETVKEGDFTKPSVPVIRGSQDESQTGNDKRKILARRIQSMKAPPDLRQSTDFSRKDDKDIRKSLHDLSQVKRTSSVKPAPLRAQHTIPIQTPQKDVTTGKTVLVKKFNKQMWRPPVGSPEGSDQRPFSPFGGTLPPSKINKKKVHEVFV